MNIDIDHEDIGPELCQECGSCCRVKVTVPKTESRFRVFLRTVLGDRVESIEPRPEPGQQDCCEKEHDITLDFGMCQHLEAREEGASPRYRCSIYESDEFPELCDHFTCVAWAKAQNRYQDGNRTLVNAQEALNTLRAARGGMDRA